MEWIYLCTQHGFICEMKKIYIYILPIYECFNFIAQKQCGNRNLLLRYLCYLIDADTITHRNNFGVNVVYAVFFFVMKILFYAKKINQI